MQKTQHSAWNKITTQDLISLPSKMQEKKVFLGEERKQGERKGKKEGGLFSHLAKNHME